MQQIHWPLYVLSRSIHYKNLTGAAPQVGLSQPQLSRLIKQLEEELGIELLDRKSKRHTQWTAGAHRLAEIYTKSNSNLEHAIEVLQGSEAPKRVRVGSLEGMAMVACEKVHKLLNLESMEEVHLDVYDLNELESQFLLGELDLIFSSRIPGGKKLQNVFELGFQKIEQIKGSASFKVLSNYEFGKKSISSRRSQKSRKTKSPEVISNSLMVRKVWLDEFGGSGSLPGKVTGEASSPKDSVALMIGLEGFHQELWLKLIG